MKRHPKMEPLSDDLFRELTEDECRRVAGGLTKKITGKITFEPTLVLEPATDGEADFELDF